MTGRQQRWCLVKKLGEGDAGEVYLVESLLEHKKAILKRPHRGSFSSEALRQAAQIRTEGQVLKALEPVLANGGRHPICAPALIDQSPPGADFGEGMFIVLEKAPGVDLASLRRIAHSGVVPEGSEEDEPDRDLTRFCEHMAARGKVPEEVLLHALVGVIELFEKIHFAAVSVEGTRMSGVIWNDVKPEHVYWHPGRGSLMIIDWGNSQLLDADGATSDRRYSRLDDYQQFLSEFGRFLSELNPDLYAQLEWPENVTPANAYSDGVIPLKDRLSQILAARMEALRELRHQEADLGLKGEPDLKLLDELRSIQDQLLDAGEIPDQGVEQRLHLQLASHYASAGDLDAFAQVCSQAEASPAGPDAPGPLKWSLLRQLAELAAQAEGTAQEAVRWAIVAGVADDWPSSLWELFSVLPEGALPDWWDEVSRKARQIHLQVDPESVPPYVVISRLFFTLQAQTFRLTPENGAQRQYVDGEALLRVFEEEVLKKWKEMEPAPPNAGVDYTDVDGLVDELESALPGTRNALEKALSQPRSQARIVMDAWGRKEFETARRSLRMLLLWDPHRRRVITADRALRRAPNWLVQVRQGARGDESFQDYLTQAELAGRALRNQVGPAPWLDLILGTFKQLRNGARPADLLVGHPELLSEIPWLNEYRSRETLSLPHTRALSLEREPADLSGGHTVQGIEEARLGADAEFALGEPLDTWLPEARGSSARVFLGRLSAGGGHISELAVKVMRPDKAEYAAPLFREEVQILTLLRDHPGVNRMAECGFIRLDDGQEIPSEERRATAAGLTGQVLRYGPDEIQNYLTSLDIRIGQGWLPYLAMENRPPSHCLMAYCDAGYTRGQFLPLHESLLLALQICDILQVVHDRNIVYRDHKILHYYWDPAAQGVVMIDWNIAKRYPQGLTVAERKFDLVQFSARALHHILTGRAAPGALPLGPNRPDEIEQSSRTYQAQWTYDDERLPNQVKAILERALNEEYSHVRELRDDLLAVYQPAGERQDPF